MKSTLILLLLFFMTEQVTAATWYVSPGSGGAGDGSPSRPFARIADVMAVAAVGDTVKLAAGVYSDTVPSRPTVSRA